MTFLYSLLAATSAVGAEVWFKTHPGIPWIYSWPAMLMALVTNFGVWGILQTESVLGLAVLFTLFVSILRIAFTLYTGAPVSRGTWIGFALVTVGGIARTVIK